MVDIYYAHVSVIHTEVTKKRKDMKTYPYFSGFLNSFFFDKAKFKISKYGKLNAIEVILLLNWEFFYN